MAESVFDSPNGRADAAQWLIEKRIKKLHDEMPPELFVDLALSIDHLLVPWVKACE